MTGLRRAAILLVTFATLAGASPAPAAEHIVRDFGDSAPGALPSDPGPPGSLRYILRKEAAAGDVIKFERPGLVELTRPIEIPPARPRLVIDGAVGGGMAGIRYVGGGGTGGESAWALNVAAENATVRSLSFQDASIGVSARGGGGRVKGVKVLDSTFTGARSSLFGAGSEGLVVQGNTFEPNQIVAVTVGDSLDARIERNRFANREGLAIRGDGVHGAVIEHNQLEGSGIQLQLERGRIAHNRIVGPARQHALNLRGNGEGADAVVEDNDIALAAGGGAARFLAQEGMTIRANRISGNGTGVVLLGCVTGARGLVQFRANQLAGAGVDVRCPERVRYTLAANRISRARPSALDIATAPGARVLLSGGELTGNAAGVSIGGRSRASITRVRVVANGGAGIAAGGRTKVDISNVAMGANAGAGIDLAPPGVSPRAAPSAPVLRYDRRKARINGKACPGCVVELYASEGDPQLGNPGHGEGTRRIGTVKAGGDGRFRFPRKGALDCPETGRVTATATRKEERTSEFSADTECACVHRAEFEFEPRDTPRLGFTNPGIGVSYEPGTTITGVTLTDTVTDERPPVDAFYPSIQWEEMRKERPGPPGRYYEDYFVQLTYRDRGGPEPTQPRQRWAFAIAYEPPGEQKRCTAVAN